MNTKGTGNSTDSFGGHGTSGRRNSLPAFFTLMLLAASMVIAGGSALAGVPGAIAQYQGTKGESTGPSLPGCGPGWVIVNSANNSSPGDGAIILPDELWGVAAVSSNDVWAVGDGPGQVSDWSATLIEHWNGTTWSVVSSPSPGQIMNSLKGVAAVSANDVWAVGNDDALNPELIEHWNGTAWSVVQAHANVYGALSAVAAVSANDVWIVGYLSTGQVTHTLIQHWDGNAWSIAHSPNSGSGNNFLSGIGVVSAHDIWAVGTYAEGNVNKTLTERWDGTSWSVVASPNNGSESNLLSAVAVVSANNVWGVGSYQSGGIARTLTEHWNGTAWTVVPSANEGTNDNKLSGVAAIAADNVWAVGSYSDGTLSRTLVEHWNGSNWSVVSSPNSGSDNNVLSAVAAASAGDVWAVGSHIPTPSGFGGSTLVERYNPCSVVTPTTTPVAACPIQFTDVPPGSTFYDYVHCLGCRGIISGYGDNTFRPNNQVTRGQLAKMVSNSAGYDEQHITANFVDVPVGSTFYPYVERLASRGIVSGYACGGTGEPCPGAYFRPNIPVTRGQASKIVAFARGLPAPPQGQQTFQDVAPGSTFWQWIEALAGAGAIQGYPCGGTGEPCVPPANRPYFRPNANITRGQAAKIVEIAFFPNCVGPAPLR